MRGFPERYIILDTETTANRSAREEWEREQTLRLGVAKFWDYELRPKDGAHYHHFTTPEEFFALIKGIAKGEERIYIFAHNIGFDLRVVDWFRELACDTISIYPPEGMKGAGRYKNPLLIMDGHPIIMRFFRPDGQQFLCVDSFNWFPTKLANIAPWTGLEEVPKPKDDAPDDAWWERCRRDVDILDRALRRLWGWMQHQRFPSFEPTPASQSMTVYCQRYEKKRIVRDAPIEALSLGRHAYYGGLTECYSVGRIDSLTHQIDITGLYPRVMLDRPYPCECEAHGDAKGTRRESVDLDPARSIAEVWIESKDRPYPLRCQEGTYWVAGQVRTVLAGPELEQAWARGDVARVGRWATFKLDTLFDGFVATYWKVRREAKARQDEMIAHAAKLLLNSLHGKFGQRDGSWEPTGLYSRRGKYGAGRVIGPHVHADVEFREINGHEFYRVRDEEHPRAFVPIAAFCSSYARVVMEEMKDLAGRENVHYQCVDSLLVNGNGLGNLQLAGVVDTGELGHFHYEREYPWIEIHGPNQLDWPGGWKHSGVKSNSVSVADGVFEVEEWESLAGAIKSGNVSSVCTRRTLRGTSSRYSRRAIGAGGRTVPLNVSSWKIPPDEMKSRPVSDVLTDGEKRPRRREHRDRV